MHSWTVRSKLALAFGSVLLVLLAIVAAAAMLLSESNQRFGAFVQGINARALVAAQVRAAVDARAIAARNLALVDRPADVALEKQAVARAHEDATRALATLQRMAQAPDVPERVRTMIAAIADIERAYAPVALDIVALASSGRREEAIRRMNDDCRPLLARLIGATDAYASFTAEREAQQVAAMHDSYVAQRNLLLAACGAALLLAVVAGLLIERSLRRDLGAEPADLRRLCGRVADGDLGAGIAVAAGDDRSVLSAVARMQEGLIGIVCAVRGGADEVSSASEEISRGNADLSSRTEQQAGALQQTAASMTQVGSTVRQNAANAQQADELARQASQVAERGGELVGQVVSTMTGITDSARRIADIIGVIDGIAFQTNILALNAAVEAARAGDAGRGFAVVAGEVRSLAGRSAEAAREIKVLIGDSVDRVERGTALVQDAGRTMQDIVADIQRVTAVVGDISIASREQSEGVTQVGHAIDHMDDTTRRNAAMVEQMAAHASGLLGKAHDLVHTVSVFRLPDPIPARARPPGPHPG